MKTIAVLTLTGICLAGCASAPKDAAQMPDSPNHALLREMNARGGWFHARKTKPIWARQLDADATVQTLEGRETVKAGDFLCRGEIGEVWPQKAADLHRKYTQGDLERDGWKQYLPRADAEGVMAIAVPHAFIVDATWGKLSGKAGDYLLKNYRDREKTIPADVWIVDRQLFEATYTPVTARPR